MKRQTRSASGGSQTLAARGGSWRQRAKRAVVKKPSIAVAATLLLLFPGCPEPRQAGHDTGSSVGDEDVMFPDERAAQEAPRHPASAAVEAGERALVEGDLPRARELFEQAVEENGQDPRARLDLGLTYELGNDYGRAAEQYRAAIEIDPEFPEALNNYGLLLRDTGHPADAIPYLRRAIEQRPGYAEAHQNLALALEETGDRQGAAEHFREAARRAEGDPFPRANLGLLLLEMGQVEQAKLELRRALSVARGDAAVLQAVGNGLRRAEDFEGAVRAMEMAVEAHQGGPTPALLSELALAQRAAGDREAAEATIRRALELDDDYAIGYYLLGGFLAGRGAYGEAVRAYERYLALEPDGPQAERARRNLQAARRAQ